jgi:hypothetical protein
MTTRYSLLVAGTLGAALTFAPSLATAQTPRLAGRLPDAARQRVEVILDSAAAHNVPVEPLVDRALEGASKGASADRIVAAVRRYATELETARRTLGSDASAAELVAGASALRAGAGPGDLEQLRRVRSGRPITVAAAVLADLVSIGVPTDSAVSTVVRLADRVDDRTFLALRRNVERDIDLGASPVAALNVRSDLIGLAPPGEGITPQPPGPRKP